MNIYLDIDAVILANDKQPALHVKEFVKYLTDNYPVFWLTTHCKGELLQMNMTNCINHSDKK